MNEVAEVIRRITPRTIRLSLCRTHTPYVHSIRSNRLGKYKLVKIVIETYVIQPKLLKHLYCPTLTDLGIFGSGDIGIVRSTAESTQVDLVQL